MSNTFLRCPLFLLQAGRHRPIMCSIKKFSRPFFQPDSPSSCTYRQRLACRIASQQQSQPWHALMQSTAHAISQLQVLPTPDGSALLHFHSALLPVLHEHIAQTAQPCLQVHSIPATLNHKWYHHRCLLACRGYTCDTMFRAWFHWTKFRILDSAHKKHAQLIRHQKMLDLMSEVQVAASRHDSFEMHQIISRYSPKHPHRRIRLRSQTGQPATPDESLQMIQHFVRDLWHGPDTISFADHTPVGVPFTVDDLDWEIRHLASTKSVARPFLPNIILKQHSYGLATWLHAQLTEWWSITPTYIPNSWKQGWLTFIGKPGKCPDRLDHLRPLALQEPLGKSVLGVLTKIFSNAIAPILQTKPQFAFLKLRSAGDAIRRVIGHCAQVRTIVANQRRSVHQRASGVQSYAVCGGIQVFLDLRKAFDVLPRQRLFDFLAELPIDQSIVQILAAWHSSTSYVLFHENAYHTVPTGRGVRQGCRIAPILWAAFMQLMFQLAGDSISEAWVQQTLTLFADDLHQGTLFRSELQLTEALTRIGLLMDILESLGLQISYEKTIIVLSIAGSNARRVKAGLLKRGPTGYYVEIPRGDGTQTKLPVQNKATYLGICASYSMFEMQSLTKRINCAHATFHRLRRWLQSRQIALKFRLQLWFSCVFTSLTYGLHAVGWTLPGLKHYHATVIKMLRTLARDHSYVTGLSNRDFLHRHQLTPPLCQLLYSAQQLQVNHSKRLLSLAATDILWTLDWTIHPQTIQLIQTAIDLIDQASLLHPMAAPAAPNNEAPFQCILCSFACDSLPNLRRHQTTVHGVTQFRTQICNAAAHALHGLPQCSTCFQSFVSWRSFQIHLERRCCEAVSLPAQLPSPDTQSRLTSAHLELLQQKPYGAALLSAIRRKAWEEILEYAAALHDLKQHCVICGVFHNRPQDLNQHLRVQHPHLVPNVFTKTVQLCRAHASISPCRYCGKTFMRSHMCPVLTQAALLCINLPDVSHTAGATPSILTCEICLQGFEDLATLHAHLRTIHRLELQDWLPSRDLLGNDPVCAHCQACFSNKAAVRQHICQGQCPQFDATRRPYQQTIQARWEELLLTGAFGTLSRSPTDRQHLTLRCQLCPAAFSRSMDLCLHLQTVHTHEWTLSQPTMQLHMLTNYSSLGCLCNPHPTSRSITHSCPAYRQLSMLAVRLPEELLIPWPLPPADVSAALTHLREHPAHDLLTQFLIGRQFSQLWQDELCSAALRNYCSLCGGHFTADVLREHLTRAHSSTLVAMDALMPLLIPCYQRHLQTDYQCPACGLVYNLPATAPLTAEELQHRQVRAQNHCRFQCPVFAQAAHLLSNGQLRPRDAGPQRGRAVVGDLQANEPVLAAPPPFKRRKRDTAQEGQASPPASRIDNKQGQATGPPAGSASGSAGHGESGSAKARLLHLLLTNAEGSHPTNTVGHGERLAQQLDQSHRGGPEDIHVPSIASSPGSDSGQQPEQSNPEAGAMQAGGPTLEGGCEARPSERSGPLAFSTMELAEPKPDQYDTASHSDGQDASICRAVQGVGAGPGGDHQVPQSSPTGHRDHDSMALSNWHQTGRAPDVDGGADREHSVGTLRSQCQATRLDAEPSSPADSGTPGQGHQREGQGQNLLTHIIPDDQLRPQLRTYLSQLVLDNPGNNCFANASLIAVLWAMLSSDTWTSVQWGERSSELQRLLRTAVQQPCTLIQFSWFQQLMNAWDNSMEQGDPVEFTTHLLDGMRFQGFNFTWERRIQIGAVTECNDVGRHTTPLTVQIDPDLLEDEFIQLRHLVHAWVNQHGICNGPFANPLRSCAFTLNDMFTTTQVAFKSPTSQ